MRPIALRKFIDESCVESAIEGNKALLGVDHVLAKSSTGREWKLSECSVTVADRSRPGRDTQAPGFVAQGLESLSLDEEVDREG
jgi:hypothetical protein